MLTSRLKRTSQGRTIATTRLGKVILVAAFGKQVIAAKIQAGKFIGGIAKQCGGGGGGRPNLAQAGGRDGAALPGALDAAQAELTAALAAV